MADDITQKCGKTTITYPVGCAFLCHCDNEDPFHRCVWGVSCNGGTYVTWGTGRVEEPDKEHPRHSHVKVAGKLEDCAAILEKLLKRPVIVPMKLKGRTIRKRTFRGTPEQIAQALGLELGRKRKPSSSRRKKKSKP